MQYKQFTKHLLAFVTCMNIFQSLSSVNCCCFSFRELKCSASGTPSISSITMYSLSPKMEIMISVFGLLLFFSSLKGTYYMLFLNFLQILAIIPVDVHVKHDYSYR